MPEYYETAFHELTHWTEHRSRLDCDRSLPENSYAFMELWAELGGCFVAAELGPPTAGRLENHASYLKHWLKHMQDDPKFIFRAAAQAAKAADLVLSFSREPAEEPAVVV
jgi:antirestriction protein ArdC